ncbi:MULTISPECIES: calcium-transporting P-type ATPase, PMR1-type [Thermoanaerobacter]|jgi:Ca2+-transporting ATPase|uniref:P-type Ca(2+) transporter n=3 Tax=Thermoanaerobacteraceae TaxID=186814 RepID=B0KBW7_THEP3|nr:calcium-translocating P-type ATPase, PMCA-type [Thermoanaerobacter pseudethanolicus ATCC 33223]ADV78864.1 calcium-translocating P-type ATPase, PMCA-type [Thermoanaerobacter brockii subsp. finnii Ako-1]KUJ90807.1 MAG: calcium-translocating P-type ATPase [Thermoanaerobacter thermocopriae]MBZ4656152.1 calcium-translocating P-type ATPase, PMCA-type [Thermoanaerobacter sp.]MDI3528378.1 P-type Ca2+ transporter type [Thermoanaerobacter sp.]
MRKNKCRYNKGGSLLENRKWYTLHATDIAELLSTHLSKGLSSEVARQRLEEQGYNELVSKRGLTFFEMFLSQFKDFLVIILIIASLVSMLVGEVIDSAVIIMIVILNAILGVIQEYRANKALDALKKMAAPEARVIRDGTVQVIPARELVPGDIVLLEAGNYVPADLRLVESVNLKIDESALTGESVPVEKNADIVFNEEMPLGDRANSAFMGTVVTYGRGKGIVVSTGMKTEIGMIAEMLESYQDEVTPLQKKLEQTGKALGIASLVISGIVFLLGLLRGIQFLEMFMTAVSLAVAAIPEGLPAIVTIVLALGMQRMVKRNALVKKLHAVETLGSTTVICSDKTGTLTQNQMTATKIFTNGQFFSISGEGYRPYGEFYIDSSKIDPKSDTCLELLLKIGALCNDSRLEGSGTEHEDQKSWRILGDPTEGALVVAAAKAGIFVEDLEKTQPRLNEIPFDSDRKLMTTIHPFDGKYIAYTKGAPDVLLSLSSYIYKNGQEVPLTQEDIEAIIAANKAMASQALRVLALAYKPLNDLPEEPKAEDIEKDFVFVGLIGMIDPPRPEAIEAIKTCKQAGIWPVMITGDHRDTAVAIAKDLGLIESEAGVLTGAELDSMSDDEMFQKSREVSVYARVSPIHKLRIVEAIKNNGHIVAMTGDGVNDAPALKKADIGVAMGITGTDVAKETADMILVDDNFASIVSAVEEGRVIYSNIRKFIFFLLSCNIAEILIIFVSMLAGLPIPLKPVQLLWINVLTDAFPALALGMEKKEPDIMQQPPRRPEEPIIDTRMRWQIAIQSIFMTVSIIGVFVFALKYTDSIEKARTFAFATLIFSELLRAFSARSETHSVFKIGFFTNHFMLWGTFISLILLLAVIYVPFLRTIFDTTYLSFYEMDIVIIFGLIPFAAAEISKIFLSSRGHR